MNKEENPIEVNSFQNYFEIKSSSKLYNVFISLNSSQKLITISISFKDINNKSMNYEKSLCFRDITMENEDFFIPFKNDIINLFKFLERLFITKLVTIKNNYNNSMNFLYLLFCVAKDNKEIQIQISIPKKSINNIMISSIHQENNNKNIFTTNYKKRRNFDCAPVPFLIGETPRFESDDKDKNISGDNNIFFFTKKKNNFSINIYKFEIKSKYYKEIILKITEKNEETKNDIEYYAHLNLMDFFNIAKSYYVLFNFSIDDIYDDFLITFHNKNIDITKGRNKIKLYFLIPNIMKIEGKNMYYKLCLYLDKLNNERTEDEIDKKIQEYYLYFFNYIQKEKKVEKMLKEEEKENKHGKKKEKDNIEKNSKNKKKLKIKSHKKDEKKNKVEEKEKEKEENNINNQKEKNENNEEMKKRGRKKKEIQQIKKFDYINKNVIIQNNAINFTIVHSNNQTNNKKKEEEKEEENNNIFKSLKEENQNIPNFFNNKDQNNKIKNNNTQLKFRKTKSHFLSRKRNPLNNNLTIDQIFKPIKKIIESNNNENSLNIPIESIHILSDKILINKIQSQLILLKAFNKEEKVKEKKFFINLIYEINMEDIKIISNKEKDKIISNFYQKAKEMKNVILLILTQENNIFGGYTKKGFILNNFDVSNHLDKDAFIFSINKMKTYDVSNASEFCISCFIDKFPEFKEQIIFDSKNIIKGKTGIKEKGFLTKEDFEINMGNKIFDIKCLQLLNISINI